VKTKQRSYDSGVVFVSGEPALLLTSRESAWREAVRTSGATNLLRPHLQFVVSGWRRGGNLFDLDNLVDPVLAVVGAPAARRRSVWATVSVGADPGVTIGEADAPDPPDEAITITLAALPRRSVRTDLTLAELQGASPLAGEGPVGCEMVLGTAAGPITFGFEGPIKPTIDALWPVLGGGPHRPHDHRIHDLRVNLAEGAVSRISLWALR